MDSKSELLIICISSLFSTFLICCLVILVRKYKLCVGHKETSIIVNIPHNCEKCNIMCIMNSKSEIDCAICLDTLVDSLEEIPLVVILSKCSHVYHKKCVESLNKVSIEPPTVNCPKCRKPICLMSNALSP